MTRSLRRPSAAISGPEAGAVSRLVSLISPRLLPRVVGGGASGTLESSAAGAGGAGCPPGPAPGAP